jgi:TrmH family RNA methyltransferase
MVFSSDARSTSISSKQNPFIKQLKKIRNDPKKYGDYFLVEGVKIIEEFISSSSFILEGILMRENFPFSKEIFSCKKILFVTDAVLQSLSSVANNQGIIALFKLNYNIFDYDSFLANYQETFFLDNLQDPRNIGGIIRTAVALERKYVVLLGGVYPFLPEVIRSSAGLIAHIRVIFIKGDDSSSFMESCYEKKLLFCVLDSNKKNSLSRQFLKNKKVNIILGNEGKGLSSYITNSDCFFYRIPMATAAESLNVAVAGSLMGYLLWSDFYG